jgi:SAM-dependent methyltransferase
MKLLIAVLFLAAYTAIAWTQTAADLPPEQRAYERFRLWSTMLSPEQRQAGSLPARYRERPKSQGLSDAEVDSEIKLVEARGERGEIELWNRVLTAENPVFNTNPNEFLVEMAKRHKPGTALDVGMGQGRDAIWLAQQGWGVTGFDPAKKAVALAQTTAAKLGVRIKTEIRGMETFDFGDRRWDLILISYVAGLHRDAAKGRSIGPSVVFDTGELPKLYPQLRVVRYEEPLAIADFGRQRVRLVRYCAERPD